MERVRSLLPRLLLLLGGVVAALALVEASLWVVGPFIAPPPRVSAELAGWRVLCVGDSFVYGLGSEDGRGMCEHLQELLDERWGAGVASVHNEGVPGFNSSQAADRLGAWLDAYEPDALVLLVGHNNSWNFNDLHLEAAGVGSGMGLARSLGRLRLVRLLRLVTRYDQGGEAEGVGVDPDLQAWSHAARKASKKEKAGREAAALEQRLAEHPDDVYSMLRLALAREAAGDQAGADALRQRARELDSGSVGALEQAQRRIERFHQQQSERGEDAYLKENPAADAALRRAIGQDLPPERLADEQRRVLDAVLRSDLGAMATQARDHGTAVLLVGYPQYKPANDVIAASAAELGLAWVDQQAAFEQRLAGRDDLSPWFLLDSHCTSAGYRIMAESLLPAVLPLGPVDVSP
jgi:lysophospholipase L1-like esterase